MTTTKIFTAASWSDVPQDQFQIKVASAGIGSNDLADTAKHVNPELLRRLSETKLDPDCFYVHKIAMGGSHRYGPNRWGDGFREEVLKRDCKTFEQNARAYRQHKSKGDHYGVVKLAGFHEGTGLVELITEYFGTPEVAKRRGGKVASMEMESMAKHGFIPVSMGSMVPGDRCVICEHWAPKPVDRCMSKKEGGGCGLFGCKTGMLQVADDGRMNYVDNPYNTFYDISMVKVGADPVANGLLLPVGDFAAKMGLQSKMASFATEQAEGVAVELTASERQAMDLAYYFSSLEPKQAKFEAEDLDVGYATHRASPSLDLSWLSRGDTQRYRDTISGLVRTRELPDFHTFAKSAGLSDQQYEAAAEYLPNLYTRLIERRLLLPAIKKAAIFTNPTRNSVNVFVPAVVRDIDSQGVLQRTCEAEAQNATLRPRKMAALESQIPEAVMNYAAMKLAYFVAGEVADPSTLFGVVRRDMFGVA